MKKVYKGVIVVLLGLTFFVSYILAVSNYSTEEIEVPCYDRKYNEIEDLTCKDYSIGKETMKYSLIASLSLAVLIILLISTITERLSFR